MKKNNILSTGEFAKLCRTTKETLFHYDRESLLKPKYVSENGYRRYGIEQYFDFDMILMFKETGSSLKEIKAYLGDMSSEDILTLLESKHLMVQKERKKLAQRETMLQDIIALAHEALDFDYDTFMVLEQEEERLEVVPTETALDGSISKFVARFVEYSDVYEKQERTPRFPFGMIVDRQDVLKGQYREKHLFSRATRSTPRSQLHIRPAGHYAVFAHKGTIQTHLEAFSELLRQTKGAGLRVLGNLYVYDMMSYILQGDGKRYTARYCVQIE